MLPPPTTTATSTPRSCCLRTWSAIAAMRAGSAPYSRSPISASPDSFNRMRLKAGSASVMLSRSASVRTRRGRPKCWQCGALNLLADLEPGEAPDHDVLACLRGGRRAQALDRLPRGLVRVHVLLVQQHDLLQPLAQPPLGDLRSHVLGLVRGLLL